MNVIIENRAVAIDGSRKSALEKARNRLLMIMLLMVLAFGGLAVRTVNLGIEGGAVRRTAPSIVIAPVQLARADIVDRNGEVLATNLETDSLYADARGVKNPDVVAAALVAILPELSQADVEQKLTSGKSFVWLKRKLTPTQKWEINALGIPNLRFEREEERIYPHGRLASHVLGYVDVDGKGLGGVEHFFNDRLADKTQVGEPLKVSLDIRVQHALADELGAAMRAHSAVGAGGLVMDVNTGEIIAMVSMPDYDPNQSGSATDDARFNRMTMGQYELGSIFKTFTVAASLDDGLIDMSDGYDASRPLKVGKYTISDDHPKERYLTIPEIFAYSSNVGMAQMADELGGERQKEFLGNLGLLEAAHVELAETGSPRYPTRWGRLSTMTVSYGYGIQVSPLSAASGIASIVNGGRRIPATLIAKKDDDFIVSKQVIKSSTSDKMRQMMRMVVREGTGSKANAVGYRVGGKTGTAESAGVGGYDEKALVSSFMGVFPMDNPRYVVFAMLDKPKGTKKTFGFAGGGWTAAPTVGNVITRSAPILGVAPKQEDETIYQTVALLIKD